ncbi:MAG: hypothetical protein Q9219_000687 [cf. Caloplaca sp. 3 TL-2023]
MNTSYVCLRCRQPLLQNGHPIRRLGFVSLSQDIRRPDEALEGGRKPWLRSQHEDRPKNVVGSKTRLRSRNNRVPQSSPGTDTALENLFNSQAPENLQTRYTAAPIHRLPQGHQPFKSKETPVHRSLNIEHGGLDSVDSIIENEPQSEDAGLPAAVREYEESSASLERQPRKQHDDPKSHRVTTIIKNIDRATQRYDVARVVQQWQKYRGAPENAQLDLKSRERIYIQFLSAFVALSRQQQAVHVWNDMLQANVTPNKKHWSIMLRGCSKVHDGVSIQRVWDNMISAGVEPDLVLWTTYIHGLILAGKWLKGLKALDDLGSQWKESTGGERSNPGASEKASQGRTFPPTDPDPNNPSLAPVQAAITALTVIQRHDLCLPLLDWAKAHSLTLTTEIFNIVLRPAVRAGDTKRVTHIFQLMEANQCPADKATYAILLNGHMSNSSFSLLSPQEQGDSICRILDDMTANKIPVDKRTYGTIIRSLLSPERGPSNNYTAAQIVLDHMAEKGRLKPDSYIYHMLVSYHFSLDPPDIAAVETIWVRIKAERPSLQSVFYEKMVEGYSRVQAVERMMFFLRRIVKEGNSPRWKCLTDVLGTLIEVGEWRLVRELVEDVRDGEGRLMRYADQGITSMAKEEFWAMVESIKGRIQRVD